MIEGNWVHCLKPQRRARTVLLLGVLSGLAGCAGFQPLSLPRSGELAPDLAGLRVTPAAALPSSHPLSLEDGLDLTELGMLAVLNNSELKVQRAQLAVAGAQAFAAGLLPDPQLSLTGDHPTSNAPGLMNAWSAGIGYDIVPLVTRQVRLDAAQQAQQKVRLDVLGRSGRPSNRCAAWRSGPCWRISV